MPLRRPVIQHSIRRPMFSEAQINSALQKLPNDITIIELESTTETGVRSITKSTLKCNCRLRRKKLLRHGNCSNKDNKKQIHLQSIPDQTAPSIAYRRDTAVEEPEIPENDSHNEISSKQVNHEKGIEYLETKLENFVPEVEDPGNNSNYSGEEIDCPENKSDINEKTEKELQGNNDLRVVIHERTIEHAQKLQGNEEAAVSKPNDKLKIEILENIVIKPANKKSNEILKTTNEIIVLKKGNSSSEIDKTEKVLAQKSNINEKINNGIDKLKLLEANNQIDLKQTLKNAKVEEMRNIELKNNKPNTKNTSTKAGDIKIIDLTKSDRENTEKAPQFDNFKVPKQVTHLKKKIVKKQQPRFVLTHVVCGYIIQESNFAFPIRVPQRLKSKPRTSNTEETTRTKVKEKKVAKEEIVSKELVPTKRKEKTTGTKIKETKVTKGEIVSKGLGSPKRKEKSTGTKVKEKKVAKDEIVTKELVPTKRKEETTATKVKEKKVAKEEIVSKELVPTKRKEETTATKVKEKKVAKEEIFLKELVPTKRIEETTATKVKQKKVAKEEIVSKELVPTKRKEETTATKVTEKKVAKDEIVTKELIPTKRKEETIATKVKEKKVAKEEIFSKELVPTKRKEEATATKVKEKKVAKEEIVSKELGPTKRKEKTTGTKIKEKKVAKEEIVSKELDPTKRKEKESVVLKESGKEDHAPPKVKNETVVQKESGIEEPAPVEMKEDEKEYANEDVANAEFSPFERLQQSTVKSWTIEDLSNYLLKFNWDEAASVLQDNEIDGASLFLVTKKQLMIIGVHEEQADVISEFVQSGSSKGN